MTKEEFLIDTINHYNSRNRNISNDPDVPNETCVYNRQPGISEGCAIGRHLLKPVPEDFNRCPYSKLLVSHSHLIPDWMLQMDRRFLGNVQELHDVEKCWDEGGITVVGAEQVKYICDWEGIKFDEIVVSCPRLQHHNT